jgi:hypothetical protein
MLELLSRDRVQILRASDLCGVQEDAIGMRMYPASKLAD